MRKTVLAVSLAALSLAGCSQQVDAYYYPDAENLSVFQVMRDVGSVENCRDWVRQRAWENNDPDLARGDYECGIGPSGSLGGATVYEETVR